MNFAHRIPETACGVFFDSMKRFMILYQSLREFLKERGVLEKFEANIKAQRVETYILNDLATAFDWEQTPEGVAFWSDLSAEYDLVVTATTIRRLKSHLYYGDDDGRPD